jgi:hypothetical protein
LNGIRLIPIDGLGLSVMQPVGIMRSVLYTAFDHGTGGALFHWSLAGLLSAALRRTSLRFHRAVTDQTGSHLRDLNMQQLPMIALLLGEQ